MPSETPSVSTKPTKPTKPPNTGIVPTGGTLSPVGPGGVETPPPSISTAPSTAPSKSSKSKGKGKGKGKGKQTKTDSPSESPSKSPSERAVKEKTKVDDPNGLGEAIVSFSPSPHPFLASIIALVGMIFVL
jgi:hypothetical protein